jgi:hypothetical protein
MRFGRIDINQAYSRKFLALVDHQKRRSWFKKRGYKEFRRDITFFLAAGAVINRCAGCPEHERFAALEMVKARRVNMLVLAKKYLDDEKYRHFDAVIDSMLKGLCNASVVDEVITELMETDFVHNYSSI